MELGIDSFAAARQDDKGNLLHPEKDLQDLLRRIQRADEVGLAHFAIGEHYRKEFLDSANITILSAAAALTKRIRLSSGVTVLSAADPVRAFQQFASLDLISQGRAEMVVGRGSFIDGFPLFGLSLNDYNELFEEKLELLLKIRKEETINWKGNFRPELKNQSVYPRPLQETLPIWVGVGGTPESFVRAGRLGLPLMVAVIGGQTYRFKPLVDLYRRAFRDHHSDLTNMQVGLHSLGYVADTDEVAVEKYFPGYKKMFTEIGQERGWPPVTREHFEAQNDELGALVVGSAETVAKKIQRHAQALGGIDRFSFQMDNALMSHEDLLKAIELIGYKVIPAINKTLKKEAISS